ncbi:MAG: peroxide stress protein YaaA [Aureispira sp.]
MLLLLSPAKTLDFNPNEFSTHTQANFLEESQRLIDLLRPMKTEDIQQLMKVSEKIAQLNVDRYKTFQLPFDRRNAKQAILAFKGDVYKGLAANEFDAADLAFAQQHIGVLSGLYGFLKPLDLMQPYRLEMGTKLANDKGKNLYEFWGTKIATYINGLAPTSVVNLASNEYFKAVDTKVLDSPLWKVDFKENKNGKYKIVAFYAKHARGMMAHYAVKNRLENPEQLKGFDMEDYQYNEELSEGQHLVFTR